MDALTRETYDLAKSVVEDLQYLRQLWQSKVKTKELRQGSGVLRRLLVDGDYDRAWRALGLPRQPMVRAPDLMAALGQTPRKYIAHSFAAAPEGVNDGLEGETRYILRCQQL